MQHLSSRQHSPSPRQQQGVVIVVALFVVALVAAIAYFMMARLTRDTERTHLILRDAQAVALVSGSVAWGKDQLRQNWANQKKDQQIDVLPLQTGVQEIEGYQIDSELFDYQGRFNLNDIKHPKQMAAFERLILTLYPKLDREAAQKVVVSVLHWLMPFRPSGEQDQYYFELPQPYRAGHRPFVSISELRLVRGVEQPVFLALESSVAAMPEGQPLNVQTASAAVLMSLHGAISAEIAKEVIRARARKPFLKTEDFLQLPQIKNQNIQLDDHKITILSQYFLLKTKISMEEQTWVIYTLLLRQVKDKKASVMVVWQARDSNS